MEDIGLIKAHKAGMKFQKEQILKIIKSMIANSVGMKISSTILLRKIYALGEQHE